MQFMSKVINRDGARGDNNPFDQSYKKELHKPWSLIPVALKSVEKSGSCGRFNICKWTVMEAPILTAV